MSEIWWLTTFVWTFFRFRPLSSWNLLKTRFENPIFILFLSYNTVKCSLELKNGIWQSGMVKFSPPPPKKIQNFWARLQASWYFHHFQQSTKYFFTYTIGKLILPFQTCITTYFRYLNAHIPFVAPGHIYLHKFWNILHISANITFFCSIATTKPFLLFQMSYMWYSIIGTSVTLLVGILVSYITGFTDPKTIDRDLLTPLIYNILPEEVKTLTLI